MLLLLQEKYYGLRPYVLHQFKPCVYVKITPTSLIPQRTYLCLKKNSYHVQTVTKELPPARNGPVNGHGGSTSPPTP